MKKLSLKDVQIKIYKTGAKVPTDIARGIEEWEQFLREHPPKDFKDKKVHGASLYQLYDDCRERLEVIGLYGSGDGYEVVCIQEGELLQAIAAVEPTKDSRFLYLHDLTAAPWTVASSVVEDSRARYHAGRTLMKAMVVLSLLRGCGGQLQLSSITGSKGFYTKLGFAGHGKLDLSVAKAKELFKKGETAKKLIIDNKEAKLTEAVATFFGSLR